MWQMRLLCLIPTSPTCLIVSKLTSLELWGPSHVVIRSRVEKSHSVATEPLNSLFRQDAYEVMVSTKDQSHNCGSHYPPVGLLPVLTLPGGFSSSLLKWAAGFGDVVQQLVNMHAHIHTHTTALNWLLLTIVPALKVYTCESHGGETMLCEFIITERGEKSLHSGARVRKASFPFCLIVNDFRSNQLWPLGVSRNYWWNMESGLRNTAVRTYMYTPALHLHDILKFDRFFLTFAYKNVF